jgi:hypothetical protein
MRRLSVSGVQRAASVGRFAKVASPAREDTKTKSKTDPQKLKWEGSLGSSATFSTASIRLRHGQVVVVSFSPSFNEVLSFETGNETARSHCTDRRRGGGVAARGASAAGRVHCQDRPAVAWRRAPCVTPNGIVSAGTACVGFHRRPEHRHRAPLRSKRPPTASRARRRSSTTVPLRIATELAMALMVFSSSISPQNIAVRGVNCTVLRAATVARAKLQASRCCWRLASTRPADSCMMREVEF